MIKEKNPQPPQEKDQDDDEATLEEDDTLDEENDRTAEEDPGMNLDTPEEIETRHKMWLMEKITTLEKENEGMRAKIQEMEAKITQQEEATKGVAVNNAVLQNAIAEIVEHVKGQIVFNESTKTSVAGLVQEDQKHQDCIMEVVRVLMNHEQHILQNCAASQEIAQNINVLLQDNQSQTMWIATLFNEARAQSNVLR